MTVAISVLALIVSLYAAVRPDLWPRLTNGFGDSDPSVYGYEQRGDCFLFRVPVLLQNKGGRDAVVLGLQLKVPDAWRAEGRCG